MKHKLLIWLLKRFIITGLTNMLLNIKELDVGLCWLNYQLNSGLINLAVKYYLQTNIPKDIKMDAYGFWWKPGAREPRMKYLNEQLLKLKPLNKWK